MNFRISDHATDECQRRQISLDTVKMVTENPGQIVDGSEGRKIYQSKIEESDKVYLIRVVVDPQTDPIAVVTVYRTSKIDKYWKP